MPDFEQNNTFFGRIQTKSFVQWLDSVCKFWTKWLHRLKKLSLEINAFKCEPVHWRGLIDGRFYHLEFYSNRFEIRENILNILYYLIRHAGHYHLRSLSYKSHKYVKEIQLNMVFTSALLITLPVIYSIKCLYYLTLIAFIPFQHFEQSTLLASWS